MKKINFLLIKNGFIVKYLCLVATLSLAMAWSLSAAQAEPIIVKNETGRPISAIYIAPAATNDWAGWGGDSHCLEPGRKWSLEWQSSSPAEGLKELRVVFDDGLDRTYFGLDLALYTYVVLGETEAELLEWEPCGRADNRQP